MTAVPSSFAEVFTSALRGEPCRVVGASAAPHRLPVSAWRQSPDAGDIAVLSHCEGATLDVGCGPGRMTQYLAERGHVTMGIDLVPEAVFQTRERGVPAMLRDVFDPLPGEGRWSTALLADGNIGIGGDPQALLARLAQVLAPGGRVVVDLAEPGTGLETRTIRLETRSRTSRPFTWSVVGVDVVEAVAAGSGLDVEAVHQHGDRWFAVLRTAR